MALVGPLLKQGVEVEEINLVVVVLASSRVKAKKYIFLGSSNRSNTFHNRRDPNSNPSSSTATKAALLPVEVGAYAGKLANFLLSWRSFASDCWVLEAVSGYRLEFGIKAVQTKLPNPPILCVADRENIGQELHKHHTTKTSLFLTCLWSPRKQVNFDLS